MKVVYLGGDDSLVKLRIEPNRQKLYVRLCRRDDRYVVRGFHFGFLGGRFSGGWGL